MPPPRLELALAPTPILKLERLSRDLGVELYLKRDDLTGQLESGSMVRKLEFLVGEALAAGADTLITCGTAQSDACRTVAAVAARLGLHALLLMEGERPKAYDGNLLLARLLGAEVRYASEEAFARADLLLADAAEDVLGRGGRPYVIPENGANEVGALGYLECAVELAEQIGHGAPRFDTVLVTAHTGVSQAGLLMGKQLAGLPSEIVGVPVALGADHIRERIVRIVHAAIRRFGFSIEVPKRIRLLEEPRLLGEDLLDLTVRLAREEGVLLDPPGTARAFAALLDLLARDPRALGTRVCVIHTGGLFGVFPHRDRLGGLLDDPGRAAA